MLRSIFGFILTSFIMWCFVQALVNGGCTLLNAWEGKHITQKTAYKIGIALVIFFWVFVFWATDGEPLPTPNKHFNLNPYNY